MMKKVVVLIGLVLLSLIYFLYSLNQKKQSNYFLKNPNALAVFVYSEAKSDYIKQKEIPKGYVLNTSKSYCKSGSEIINYDRALGIVNYDLKNDDQCYLYFDIYLPAGYTELTYIESSGTQYIDTGYVPNQSTRVVVDFDNDMTYTGDVKNLFGARVGGENSVFGMWINEYTVYPHYGHNSYDKAPIAQGTTSRMTYDMNQNMAFAGRGSSTFTAASFNSTYNLTILAMNFAGTIDVRRAVGKLYSVKIYNDSTLVRDMIPCKNPSGVVGMYDLVGKRFYGNSGSGSFIAGTTKSLLPNGYTQVEYLESTGTQYINSGVYITDTTIIETDLLFTSAFSWNMMFGIWSSESGCSFSIVSTGAVCASLGGKDTQALTTLSVNTKYNVRMVPGTGIAINGTNYSSINGTPKSNAYPIFIFAASDGGNRNSPYAWGSYGQGRIYTFKIWQNGALVRDFIPALNASGTPGLYDAVNKKFYTNNGSGTFSIIN